MTVYESGDDGCDDDDDDDGGDDDDGVGNDDVDCRGNASRAEYSGGMRERERERESVCCYQL